MMKVVVAYHNFVNTPKKYTEPSFCLLLYMGLKLCFILREEHRLRVFQDRVLRKIFGPQRDKVTGDWTRLYHVITDLYS